LDDSNNEFGTATIKIKKIVLGTLSYTIGTFGLAVTWHVLLFEDRYRSFGYFEGDPSFIIGFITILLQGMILSVIYPLVQIAGVGVLRGIKFSLLIGSFFWTSHVLAFIAKQPVQNIGLFVTMETVYLALQFGLFGVLIGLIYRDACSDYHI
jgi:hypothetical protein